MDARKMVSVGAADEVEREELVEQVEQDIDLQDPKSEEDLEGRLVNEIDYLIGCAMKHNADAKTQKDLVDILISNDNFYSIRKALSEYVMVHRFL